MLEPFVSSQLLIERVSDHLQLFEHVERTFIAYNPYARFSEVEPQSGDVLFKIKAEAPSAKLSAVAFDIVNGLRAALDHVVYDSARIVGGNPRPQFTKFPFGRTIDQAALNLSRYKDSEVPLGIRPYLLGFEPYEGGKEAIWELNELRNQKIHRILQSFPITAGGWSIGNGIYTNVVFRPTSVWDAEKRELTYFRADKGSQFNGDIDASIRVIIGEPAFFSNKPAIDVFRKFLEVVQRICAGVEAESERLRSANR